MQIQHGIKGKVGKLARGFACTSACGFTVDLQNERVDTTGHRKFFSTELITGDNFIIIDSASELFLLRSGSFSSPELVGWRSPKGVGAGRRAFPRLALRCSVMDDTARMTRCDGICERTGLCCGRSAKTRLALHLAAGHFTEQQR